MKQTLAAFGVLMLLCYSVFAYTPSTDLVEKMDEVIEIFEETIDVKGESYRDNFLSAIKNYQVQYEDDERISYILEYLLDALSISGSVDPNILLIIADDMGLDAMPGFKEGNIKPYMPNIESMMENGVSYENLWSAPVCTPTRATIMTGKYGYTINMLAVDDLLDTNEVGLQSYLDQQTQNSYVHAVIGKWHIGNTSGHPEDMGVGYYAGMQNGGAKSYYNWRFTENQKTTNNSEYITTKFTDLAIDWLDVQEKPWFLWLAYTAPHTPFHLPPSELHYQGDLPDDEISISENPTPYYMAVLEAMDSEIGRLLASIPEDELKNTTILFIGDNGTPGQVAQFPYSRRKAKGSLYEGGINVPMVVSGYGVSRSGELEQRLVNTTDLYATIAEIAGVEVSQIHDSYSITDSFTSQNTQDREYVYSEIGGTNNSGYTVRNKEYKFIVFENKDSEMYDLISDPYESINLLNRELTDTEYQNRQELEGYVSQIQK